MELQYSDIIWLILFIHSMWYLYVKGMGRKEWIKLMSLFGGLFLCIIVEVVNPNSFNDFNMRSLLIFVRILMMVLVYKALLSNFSTTEIRYFVDVFLKMQVAIYIIVIIEFFIKNKYVTYKVYKPTENLWQNYS